MDVVVRFECVTPTDISIGDRMSATEAELKGKEFIWEAIVAC